ncbi:MAG: hypothetical protein P8164_08595 [Gammaproteobacteria bacterium]|jgi:hypothetical protein
MKVFFMITALSLSLWLSTPTPVHAGDDPSATTSHLPALEQQQQSVTEELMGMLKSTMTILRDMDHRPSPDEKRRLDAMISRLDTLMIRQKEIMRRLVEEQRLFMQRQNEILQQIQPRNIIPPPK